MRLIALSGFLAAATAILMGNYREAWWAFMTCALAIGHVANRPLIETP